VKSQPLYIVDIMRDVVKNVELKVLPQLQAYDNLIQGVHYDHGHPAEIIETLKQKDKSDTLIFKKYPAVFLFQDFTETMGEPGVDSSAKLHLLIVAATSSEYKAHERYEKNFKPILYPIYLELKEQIFKSGKVMVPSASSLSFNKIDRLFWGRQGLYGNESNVFNDFLDAIEIQNLDLKFYKPVCLNGCATK